MEKKGFNKVLKNSKNMILIFTMFAVLIFAACKQEEEFKTKWEETSVQNLQTYNDNCKVVNDSSEGELFLQYSLFDKTIDANYVNNISFKNIGYNTCGFEGKFKYASGPIILYGFLLNVDLDENSFYMLSITQNGGFELYYYNGNTASPSSGAMEEVFKLSSANSPIKKDVANKIKVDTVSEDSIEISFNGEKVYTISNPLNKRGSIGIFQMLDSATGMQNFTKSNPMVSLYQLNKIQRY